MESVTIIIGIITFILGNVCGYFLHDFFKKTLMIGENTSKNLLLLAVTIIWVLSMLVSLVNPAYQVPIPVHGIMGIIVGFFFYNPNQRGGNQK